jgi:hypothetical protein
MCEKTEHDSKVKTPGPSGPGSGTGPLSPAAEEHRVVPRNTAPPRPVERATALRGQGIGRPPPPKSAVRRQTLGDIYGRDPEIPYVKFEASFRDLVCSLMERQDRMNEEIFYRMNDLGSRLDDLEDRLIENGGGQ